MSVVEAFLATYGGAGLRALKVVMAYIKWREERFGKRSKCVTYEGLRKYITYRRLNIKFTTLERALRKLAEEQDAPLKRVKLSKNTVIFCVNENHPILEVIK